MNRLLLIGVVGLSATLAACRGGQSGDEPIHVFGDMDWQPKYQALQESPLFADGRAMRPLVDGTVSQEGAREDDGLYRGKTATGEYLDRVPFEVTKKTIDRGQDRFNIYCAPCHDQSGSGHGLVVQRGYPPPIDLSGDRVRGLKDGEVFNVITHGKGNMPSYRAQIPPEDRWAIVTWLRVIGHSQHAKIDEVPAEMKGRIEPEVTP